MKICRFLPAILGQLTGDENRAFPSLEGWKFLIRLAHDENLSISLAIQELINRQWKSKISIVPTMKSFNPFSFMIRGQDALQTKYFHRISNPHRGGRLSLTIGNDSSQYKPRTDEQFFFDKFSLFFCMGKVVSFFIDKSTPLEQVDLPMKKLTTFPIQTNK